MLSLIATKLRKILTMRRAIVAFVISAFLISVPLFTAWAQAEGVKEIVANVASKVVLGGPILVMATLVNAYVGLLGLLSLQMIHFFLKLAAFNDFINFAPVIQGWTIIRDVVNMSFVIILLMIAISTILGIEAYSYRRLLPRLVLMAVLINFSRTIAGLLIDAGQVVMLTFVNAFSAAAGGNFINALHINDLLSIANAGILSLDVTPITIFSSYILAAVAITVTFIVMLVFAGILLFRILSLWFLIVLSPLAFALGAWPSGGVSKYYGQWWDEFTKNIICPTVLSFFLWLALMMMSSNYVTVLAPGLGGAGEKGAPLEAAVTQLAIPETFASFLIGIGFLLMVLKMTQSLCGSIAGFAPKILDFAKRQGVAAAKLAGKGGLLGTAAVANLGLRKYEEKRGKEYKGTIEERGFSALTNVPIVRGWAYDKLGKARAERAKLMGPPSEVLSKLNFREQQRALAVRPPILTPDNAAKRAGQLFFGLTDKNYARETEAYYRQQLEPQLGKEEAAKKAKEKVREEMAGYMKEYNEVAKVAATPEITRKAIEIKNTRPDLLEGKEFADHVGRMDPEDIKKMSPAAFEGVIDRPEMSADTRFRFLEAAEKGSFGLQKIAKEKRDEFAKQAAAKGGEVQDKFWKQEEAAFRTKKYDDRLRDQDIGEDDVANPYIAKLLAQDKNYSAELENILRKNDDRTEALRKTLVKLQQTLTAKPDGGMVERNGKKVYNPEMLVLSENIVRAGSSPEEIYRLKEADAVGRNSYAESLQGKNKINIMLKTPGDILRTDNYNNEVAVSIVNALSKKDLGDLVGKAGKDPAARQTLSDIVKAIKSLSRANPHAADLLDTIKRNPIMYRGLNPGGPGKKGQGGGGSSAPPDAEGPEDEVNDEDKE